MRIAIWKHGKSQAQAEIMLEAFRRQAGDGAFEVEFSETKQPEELIYSAQADAILLPLADMPTQTPEATVFTAVLPRLDAHTYLAVGKDVLDFSVDFRIKAGADVVSNHFILSEQLRNYRPELHYRVQKMGVEVHSEQGAAMCVLYGDTPMSPEWHAGEQDHKQIFPLDPREITPIAGAGVLAFLCLADDFHTRTALKRLHDPQTVQCSNIERAFERAFAEGGNKKNTAAHCHRDRLGNFHAQFCIYTKGCRLERLSLSRSTFAGLAEEAIAWGERLATA